MWVWVEAPAWTTLPNVGAADRGRHWAQYNANDAWRIGQDRKSSVPVSEWVSEYDGPAIYLLKMNAPASGTVVCVLDYTSRQQWTREPSAGDHNLGGVDCRAVTVRLLRQDSQSKL